MQTLQDGSFKVKLSFQPVKTNYNQTAKRSKTLGQRDCHGNMTSKGCNDVTQSIVVELKSESQVSL